MSGIHENCYAVLHAPADLKAPEKRQREKTLEHYLREKAYYPEALHAVLFNFVGNLSATTQHVRWGAAQKNYYAPGDKLELVQGILDKTYRVYGDSGTYRLPKVKFAMLEDKEFAQADGEVSMQRVLGQFGQNGIVLNEELKERSIEELFTVTAHECGHSLVRDYRFSRFGMFQEDEAPGLAWSRLASGQHSTLYDRFYYACPEEALVRQFASFAIDRMSPDKAEVLHCTAIQMVGYADHCAATTFKTYVEAGLKTPRHGSDPDCFALV